MNAVQLNKHTSPFEIPAFREHRNSRIISRLLGLPCSDALSKLLPATLLRLLARNHSLEALGESQYDQSDEVLNHLNNPSCWCPKLVFGVINCASIAHEASRSRLARSV